MKWQCAQFFFTVTMAKLCFLRSFFKQHTDLYTDAAQSKGFAGIYGRQYFFGSFSEFQKVINIMTLEFYPIILSIAIWGKLQVNHSILFFTDNEALVAVIIKQTCKDTRLLQMVRFMVLQCLKHNIVFRAKHIPGKSNVLADSLSRLQVAEFHRQAPKALKHPTEVPIDLAPDNFWPLLHKLHIAGHGQYLIHSVPHMTFQII